MPYPPIENTPNAEIPKINNKIEAISLANLPNILNNKLLIISNIVPNP